MNFNYLRTITAAALLAIPGMSFAADEIGIDANGDLRITLAGGVDRELIIGGGIEPNNLPVFVAIRESDDRTADINLDFPVDFAGDFYIDTSDDINTSIFVDLIGPGTFEILTGPGNDEILFGSAQIGGVDVRARQGDDFIALFDTIVAGRAVLRGFSGDDEIFLGNNVFQQNMRIRGGRDDDEISVSDNTFLGNITRINGRKGEDTLFVDDNLPELTTDNFRSLENINR